jgi:hypothetical protein
MVELTLSYPGHPDWGSSDITLLRIADRADVVPRRSRTSGS